MAKRRSPRVVWLPPDRFNRLGVAAPAGATTGLQNGILDFIVDVPGGPGSSATGLSALVQDFQPDVTLLTTGTLADYAQSAYRLRRVVGKIFITLQQNGPAAGIPPFIIVTAGLIVLRINPDDPTGQPIQANQNVYSTQMLQNWTDPWIWRRTWVIGNLVQAASMPGQPFWPENNVNTGSALDGPHVDAKTARIVGPEERLFLVVTGTAQQGDEQFSNPVRVLADLRVLASMRSSQGNRRNASR